MKYKAISLALILIAPTPFYISLVQYLSSGDIKWAMTWANEQVFWSLLFSIFAFIGIVVAYIKEKNNKVFMFILCILLMMVLFPVIFDLINVGFEQSSKEDSAVLEPMGFWLSGWWK